MGANTNQKLTSNDKNSEISINHQKLIDATIETIAKRGLADTTISHVAKKAEVSQGYANFRFKSKENLLLSSLQFLSDEYKKSWQKIFEDENLDPIDRLLRICENDFSKKIANQNKISVWIAFYSEVKFRPSYRSVCQDQDEIYLNQTKKLIDDKHLADFLIKCITLKYPEQICKQAKDYKYQACNDNKFNSIYLGFC